MSRSVTRALVALGLVLLCLAPAHAHHPHSATGTLTVVLATDKKTGVSTAHYRVGDTPVSFRTNPPRLATGMYVEVQGEEDGAGGIVAANGSSMRVITTAPAPSAPTGVQTTVVLIVNLRDKQATMSVATARQIMFAATNSVDALYREASFGKVSFSGDVFGPFTIANSSSETDEWKWAYAADDAASANGVVLSNYKRRVYVFPDTASIEHSGLGTIGGTPSRSWIYDDEANTFAHELGHNLGLQHASTPSSEYGDASCPMGNPSGLVHHNGPHKAELGWVPTAQIQTIAASGTYQIANLEEDRSLVQILRIAKPDTGETYWLSYRHAVGFDATNLSWRYRARTSIHRFTKGERSFLLASLADGETWKDSVNLITIKQTAHDATRSTISVTFGAKAVAPSVALASATSSAAGASRSLTVTVTNNDTVGSAATTFALSASAPSGWTATLTPATVTLASGASGTATLRVTPPSTATAGAYTVRVSTSSAQAIHAASAATTYTVTAPATTTTTTVAKASRVTATSLNVRETPMGTILGAVPSGHVFVRTGRTDQGFSEVFWAGRRAWVSSSYLAGTTGTGGKVTASSANVRTGPSSSNTILKVIATGEMYADAATGGTTSWRAIQWDGKTAAWVYRSYTSNLTLEP